MTLKQLQATMDAEERLLLATRELGDKNKILKVLCKLRTRETHEAKELHLLEVSEAESQVIECSYHIWPGPPICSLQCPNSMRLHCQRHA